MQEYSAQAEVLPQTDSSEGYLLRGYDPLREIYHWSTIILALAGELLLFTFALGPFYNNLNMFDSESWSLPASLGVLGFLSLGCLALPLISFILYRREKRTRDVLRFAALKRVNVPLMPIQPPALQSIPLPTTIESSLQRSFIGWNVLGFCSLAVLLSFNIAISMFWQTPIPFADFFPLLSFFVPVVGVLLCTIIQGRVAGHYLLPSLVIDDQGITAHYGRDTIEMRWSNMRYFALVNSWTLRKASGYQTGSYTPAWEAFEISDGENKICWLISSPFYSRHLHLSGERVLSTQEYTSLTGQLASLIVARTGLPLVDCRLPRPARKQKREKLCADHAPQSIK